jgi:hypothetical protein
VTKPPPQHGTVARRKHHKCPCNPCREAYNAYQRNCRRQKAYGRWQPLTDAEPVRQHLRTLMAAGISYYRVADMIGTDYANLTGILYAKGSRAPRKRIKTTTATLILAISPQTEITPQRVDATGTRRRLQALIVMGWPQRTLALLLGRTGGGTLNQLLTADFVYSTTANSVRRLYANLRAADPETHGVSSASAKRTRTYSRRQGWHGPLAWDTDTIDDPAAQPDTEGEGTDEARKRDNDRPAEIKHLAGFGFSAHTIGRQVGLPEKDVEGRIAKLHAERNRKQAVA